MVELARPCIATTRTEKGCIRYELFLSVEDDVTLQFIEEWTDPDALRAHMKAPHLATFRDARKDIVDEGGSLKIFEAQETSLK